jgi:TetR/AcrR family transcriptional regulator, regulator of cefoperazone and chloramphenicol sensitivity
MSSDDTRARILRVALQEFAARGFERTTVRDIVSRAKVNQAAINYHFRGKRELYLEVLHQSFAALTSQAVDSVQLDALSREKALRAFVSSMMMPILSPEEQDAHHRLIAWEAINPSGMLSEFHDKSISPHFAMVRRLIARFVPEDRKDVVDLAALWLIGQCASFHHVRNSPFKGLIERQRAEDIAAFVADLALGGLRSLGR